MGLEGRGILKFDSHDLFRFVGILLTTCVATDLQVVAEFGRSLVGVGLSERNLVREKQVLPFVETMVLAEYCPEVFRFRHLTAPVIAPATPLESSIARSSGVDYGGLAFEM
jgi:hypothetical protein